MRSNTSRFIYYGNRGEKFVYFLNQILTLGNLTPTYRSSLLDNQALKMYGMVFTHKTADPINNYEFYEFLGDSTLNKSVAWYVSRRFPQLNCPEGVKILTRLKINLISTRSFARFAKRLKFWEFISADSDTRATKMDKTLEDVFEAFFGLTEYLLDERVKQGIGYQICYNIIHNLLNTIPLSLKYEDLFDAKTRLKETFQFFNEQIGELVYKDTKIDKVFYIEITRNKDNEKIGLGRGEASLKADAEQMAARVALETLKKQGFVKPLGETYVKFCI
jgi:dsRNA-specific ribonuclease